MSRGLSAARDGEMLDPLPGCPGLSLPGSLLSLTLPAPLSLFSLSLPLSPCFSFVSALHPSPLLTASVLLSNKA